MTSYAKIVADSVTLSGDRLTTLEVSCWRPVLAEQNTHRCFARNSASSRAIPVERVLDAFMNDFCVPELFQSERVGMSGGPELRGDDLADALFLWKGLQYDIGDIIGSYLERHPNKSSRLHKSLLNRWLEPGLMQTQVVSGTSFDGYFSQRCHEDADPNLRVMACAIRDALDGSEPVVCGPNDWHLPFWGDSGGHVDDWLDAGLVADRLGCDVWEVAKRCSAARCARVSYMSHNGVRDLHEDLDLFYRLVGGDVPHASPLEHVACPWADNTMSVETPGGKVFEGLPRLGCFTGWLQFRHELLGL